VHVVLPDADPARIARGDGVIATIDPAASLTGYGRLELSLRETLARDLPRVGLAGRVRLFVGESRLVISTVFLVVAMGTVLLGTLYPLALDALGLGKISVGPPYFDAVFFPLMVPVLLFIGVGPYVAWKQGSLRKVWLELRALAAVSLLLAGAVSLGLRTSVGVSVGVLLSIWVLLGTAGHLVQRLSANAAKSSLAQRWRGVPRAFWGMVVAHAGIGIFVLGVTLVKGLDHAEDASLKVGDAVSVGGYRFQFKALDKVKGPNYIAGKATFDITRDGVAVATLHPEKRFYLVQRMPMTEAGIDRGFTRDLYVSLGEASPDGAWGVRLQVKPFMGWVWGGCVVMALGGLLAATDRRYRGRVKQPEQAATVVGGPHPAMARS